MFTREAISTLKGVSDAEATPNRRSPSRPDSPYPRELRQLLRSEALGRSPYDNKENAKIGSKQSDANMSPMMTPAPLKDKENFTIKSMSPILSETSSASSLEDGKNVKIRSNQNTLKITPIDTSAMADDSMRPPSSIGSPLFSAILSPLSTWSGFGASLSPFSISRSIFFPSSPRLTPRSPFSCSLSRISRSSSVMSIRSRIMTGFPIMSLRSRIMMVVSKLGIRVGTTKRVSWAEHLETEIFNYEPVPHFWVPGQQYRPVHLTNRRQALLAQIQLLRIPLSPSEDACWVSDGDNDKDFFDKYYDVDLRCERRLYRKLRKLRRREALELFLETNFGKLGFE